MLQFCEDIDEWNMTHDRQVYAATFYRYPCWDGTFHLDKDCSSIDNPAFRNMTANCDGRNAHIDNQVIISNPRVQVSSLSKSLVVRWDTNLPSKTMLWYWNPLANSHNGEFLPLNSSLVTQHQMTMDNAVHVQPQTEYHLICRSRTGHHGERRCGPGRHQSQCHS